MREASKTAGIRFNRESASFENVGGELDRWKAAYPNVSIEAEIARAAAWAKENPPKRQWGRFLVNWLARAQSRNAIGGSANAAREMGRNAAADTFGI